MTVEQAVISGADEFREQQHLQLEPHAQRAPAKTKRRETPVRSDPASTEAVHRAAEQTRVFRLLGEPPVHQEAHLVGAAAESFRIMRNQRGRAAAIAEPKLFQRREQCREDVRTNRYGSRPVRFGAVLAVAGKVSNPFGVVHKARRIHAASNSKVRSGWDARSSG